jgi:arsenate reductase
MKNPPQFLFLLVLFCILAFSHSAIGQPNKLYPILNDEVKYLYKEFDNIDEVRRIYLDRIVTQFKDKILAGEPIDVTLIDYANGAISQMAQAWGMAAAYYYGHPEFKFYSGGIGKKEINTLTIQTLEHYGFIIYKNLDDGKPIYEVYYSYGVKPFYLFPKKYRHHYNPASNFIAITLQDAAEMNLPMIKGALIRESIDFTDPAGYLGREDEREKYRDVSRKIALEMFYIFSKLKHVRPNG